MQRIVLISFSLLVPLAGILSAEIWKQVPNLAGLEARVPSRAVPNARGGMPGFHSPADDFSFILRLMDAEEASRNFAAAKKETEENELVEFIRWVEKKQIADGWVLVYEEENLIFSEADEEWKAVGTRYSFSVRRTFAGKAYTCYGALKQLKHAQEAARSCESIRKG